jgi:hypothetical protein
MDKALKIPLIAIGDRLFILKLFFCMTIYMNMTRADIENLPIVTTTPDTSEFRVIIFPKTALKEKNNEDSNTSVMPNGAPPLTFK